MPVLAGALWPLSPGFLPVFCMCGQVRPCQVARRAA
jgi:hypothetical protein